VIGVTVLFADSRIRTHFKDAYRQMEEEMDGLTNLKANLEILVEAVEDVVYESGSVSVPMLQIDKVLDLQLVVGNIKMYKNKVPYLALQKLR
jgi:hypothetical protein